MGRRNNGRMCKLCAGWCVKSMWKYVVCVCVAGTRAGVYIFRISLIVRYVAST